MPDIFLEELAFDLVEFKVIDNDPIISDELAAIIDSEANPADTSEPLLNRYRSLAKVQFILCHSLPTVNSNGATWTYPTLVNSCKTVANQVMNLNHELKDNQKVLGVKLNNNIIGHMIEGNIAELPKDDNGFYPLIPENPIAVTVTAYLYKRIVPDLINRLSLGEKFKVSMECEFTDVSFIFDGNLYSRSEKPELLGKREWNGKPIVRVLGGSDPSGGIVNFWGCAILDNQKPADIDAEVLSTVASEIGEMPTDFINLIEDTSNMPNKNFIERLPKEIAVILEPLLSVRVEDISDELIAQALIDHAAKVTDLESEIKVLVSEVAAGKNLPLADGNPVWSASAAKKSIAKLASKDGSGDKDTINWSKYSKAFMYVDPENKEAFGGYKLPFADVIEGELKAIPRALYAVAAVLNGSRGGVDIPEADKESIKSTVAGYYKKLKKTVPWSTEKASTEAAYISGTLDDQLQVLRDQVNEELKESGLFDDSFYISALFTNSVIINVWDDDQDGDGGYWQIPYALTEDKSNVIFGKPLPVEIKEIIVPRAEPITGDEDENEVANNNEGDPKNMPKNKEVAQETELDVTPVAPVVDEALVAELASLKDQLTGLIAENLNLKSKIEAHETEKEAARRSAVLESRKAVLAQDFDLDELLEGEDENDLASMSDEEFSAHAAKMKKIAAKFKKVPAVVPDTDNDKANSETHVETAGAVKPVKPLSPEGSNNKGLKSRLRGF